MGNGLIVGIDEFRSLPSKKKLDCLYENQVKTLHEIKRYKFHQKIQYPWLTTLTIAAIFIIKHAVSS